MFKYVNEALGKSNGEHLNVIFAIFLSLVWKKTWYGNKIAQNSQNWPVHEKIMFSLWCLTYGEINLLRQDSLCSHINFKCLSDITFFSHKNYIHIVGIYNI